MDEESSQQFFNLAMVVVVLGLVFAMMGGGCTALGLSDAKDGTAEFWRSLERQSGGASL